MENVREGENENIDAGVRARARASVNKDPLGDFIKSKGLDRGVVPVAAPDNLKEISMQAQGRSARTKPAMITKEQMEREGFTDLRDYLNFKGNFKRRPDKVSPDMGSTSDKAFLDFVKDRNKPTYAKGGVVSASRRGDGIAQRGKTRGRMC